MDHPCSGPERHRLPTLSPGCIISSPICWESSRGDAYVDEYREKGFVFHKGFFEKGEIDLIREEAKRVFALQMVRLGILGSVDAGEEEFEAGMFRLFEEDIGTFANCGKQAQHLISLHRLSLDGQITTRLNELGLGFPNVSTRPVMMFNHERLAKKEVYWRLSAHQDWRSMQGSLDSMVVWVPLVDVSKDLGRWRSYPAATSGACWTRSSPTATANFRRR